MDCNIFWGLIFGLCSMAHLGICGPIYSDNISQADKDLNNMFTYVGTDANIKHQPRILVYSDFMELTFVIPDVPDMIDVKNYDYCPNQWWCRPSQNTNNVILDTAEVLKVYQKILTLKGVGIKKDIQTGNTTSLDEDDSLDKATIQKVGIEWYGTAKTSIDKRRPFTTNQRRISKRGLPILPAVKIITPLLPHLWKGIKNIFVPNNKILPFLTHIRSKLPKTLLPFTDFPHSESKFSEVLRKSVNVVQKYNKIYLDHFQTDIAESWMVNERKSPFPLDELFRSTAARIQNNIHNIANVQNFFIELQGHQFALEEFRNENIPLLFVPPELLQERIRQLESSLDEDVEMVLTSEDAMSYYGSKLATCTFDNDGGIVQIKAMLKPKNSEFRLYEFQSMAFAWNNYTCDLGIPSTYVIQEIRSQLIFAISDVDEEDCQPKNTGVCKVPQAANADIPNHYCLLTLMQGGTTAEVKAACPLVCRKGIQITSTQVDDHTFVVAHLPKAGAKVYCDNKFGGDIFHDVEIGAIRINLKCGCLLTSKGKVIARSSGKVCDSQDVPYSHLLPIQVNGNAKCIK